MPRLAIISTVIIIFTLAVFPRPVSAQQNPTPYILQAEIKNDPKCGPYMEFPDQDNLVPVSCPTSTKINFDGVDVPIGEDPEDPTKTLYVEKWEPSDVVPSDGKTKEPIGTIDMYREVGIPYEEMDWESLEYNNKEDCDYIFDMIFTKKESPLETRQGRLLKFLTPDDIFGDSRTAWCNELIDWHTLGSKGVMYTNYKPPALWDKIAGIVGLDGNCLGISNEIILPTFGPTMATNRLWHWVRSPNYTETDNEVEDILLAYREEEANQYACISPDILDIRYVRNSVAQESPQDPQGDVLGLGWVAGCGGEKCKPATRKDEDNQYDVCIPDGSGNVLHSLFGLLFNQSNTESYIQTQIADFGGGKLFDFRDEPNYPVYDYASTFNYKVSPKYLTGPQELKEDLWSQVRFSSALGDDWKIPNMDQEGSLYFGIGHSICEQVENCHAMMSPEQKASGFANEACGIKCEDIELEDVARAGAQEMKLQPGAYDDGESGPKLTGTGESLNADSVWDPDNLPPIAKEGCVGCTPAADSAYSSKLLGVLEAAGSKYDVPATVLLGILELEGWHPGGPHLLSMSDADLDRAINNQDPYCVRNSYCAAGPFQFLTSPSLLNGNTGINLQDANCSVWNSRGLPDTWSTYSKASPNPNPNPCNLVDAAYAAAYHVRSRVDYWASRPTSTTCGAGTSSPESCEDWDRSHAKAAFCSFHGNCSLGYCDRAASRMNDFCSNGGYVMEEEGLLLPYSMDPSIFNDPVLNDILGMKII